MAERIPLGQPILVGHHSEGRDRRYRARIDAQFRKGHEALDEARALERRIAAAESNAAISSDDPAAIEKLRAKLAEVERQAARAREVNQLLRAAAREASRSGLSTRDAQEAALRRAGVSGAAVDALLTPDFAGRVGVPSFKLTNLSAEARRIKTRIAELEQRATAREREPEIVGDIRLEEANNRVRVIFAGKPAEAARALLKSRGFRWSPSAGAWQRQATERAWYDAREIAKRLASSPEESER